MGDFTLEQQNSALIEEIFEREKDDLLAEYEEYKEAMEYYFGRGRCLEALDQYRNDPIFKTGR